MSEQHEIALPDATRAEDALSSACPDSSALAGDPTLVYGVDEAGRGPWLGPMAMAVVVVNSVSARALEQLGVQDSKRFGSGKKAQALRGELAETIASVVLEARCVLVPVPVIDARTLLGQLNHLERDVAVDLLEQAFAEADRPLEVQV